MVDIELTELQTKIYEIVKEDESISKKNLAKRLDFLDVRKVASPLKSMIDSGVLVTDEYADYSIAAGVREDDGGHVNVPVAQTPAPVEHDDTTAGSDDADEDNLYSEYWQKHPEELVTYHQEEGLDAIKRNALQAALENTPGVGARGLNSSLHWFDIDEDVRREPTMLMRALEDAGVKHNVVGRVARETFLPEKQYSQYIRADTEVIIDRGRRTGRQRTSVTGNRRLPDDGEMRYEERYDERYDDRRDESARYRQAAQYGNEEPPQWYHALMSRIDNLGRDQDDRRNRSSDDNLNNRAHIVVEPVLDESGNPVPDPNNPGQYLERKLIYDAPGSAAPLQNATDSRLEQVLQIVEDQKDELARMNAIMSDVETDRKINDAIGSQVNPLLSKIHNLEKAEPVRKAGLSDEQYKLQTEKELFQDVTNSVESTVANVLTPIIEGLQETQKMQAMLEISALERREGVQPGTYLKYMTGGGGGEDVISQERVGNTIDLIKQKTGDGR